MEEINLKEQAMIAQYGEAPELDLSKIKNINANKSKGNNIQAIETKVKENTFKEKKNKFCFTEEHEVELPSRGYLYQESEDEDIKKGIVRLRPMSLADEEIIANQSYVKNGTVFVHLLNSCMLNNFDARNFIPYDVFYLIYTLRQITYGEDYDFEVTCPECEKKFDFKMKISDATFSEIESNVETTKKIKLPVSKFTLTMRCSLLGDEEEVYKFSKKNGYEDFSDNILGYIVRTSEILDEKGEEIPKKDYPYFFEALPGKDRSTITKSFEDIDNLEIPTVPCVCPKCGHEREITIPFSKNFFRS